MQVIPFFSAFFEKLTGIPPANIRQPTGAYSRIQSKDKSSFFSFENISPSFKKGTGAAIMSASFNASFKEFAFSA